MKFKSTYRCFHFKKPSGTSRGVLTEKHAWFLEIMDGQIKGIGECSVIPGLSPEFESLNQYNELIEKFIATP